MVRLLAKLVPAASLTLPLSSMKMPSAACLEEFSSVMAKAPNAPMYQALEAFEKKDLIHTQELFDKCVREFDHTLRSGKNLDPMDRLLLHEAIIGSLLYERTLKVRSKHDFVNPVRRALKHYDFDVRRDRVLGGELQPLLDTKAEMSAAQNLLISEMVQSERFLFGEYRLRATQGKQWVVGSISLTDIKEEDVLVHVLGNTAMTRYANLDLSWIEKETVRSDPSSRWKKAVVKTKPETERSSWYKDTLESKETPASYELSVLKPALALPFWEWLWMKWLTVWTYLIGAVIAFFLVDEEVLGLSGIIMSKYWATKQMRREAAERGESKIYVAKGSK